ncbi:EAL domain-containing protein [Crocosphaera watsonii WH 8501]|uniref:GGDEF n=1 Tax=Crocosphaera watsonii WH 8501 TaxID=165597 RepID=Q4C2V1_CROWT|nr:EAL domain-containing protein [Crocosphaera watsonii]EAM50487.1 GGDEF [Crocosphaera watsonii WH 8501]
MNQNRKNTKNRYVLVLEDSNCRRTISLEESEYSLGRHSSNSIIIYSKQVSRRHATLIKKFNRKINQDSFWILDGDLEGIQSRNGIFVNGEKCTFHELKDGDLINFGCEVNASYHTVSPSKVSSDIVDKDTPKQSDKSILRSIEESQKLNLGGSAEQSTFILADSNSSPKELGNDDTFQEESSLDPVTELPNRILFNEYVSIAVTNGKRHKNCLAVFLIDIKDFKKINDAFGYTIGDYFLQAITQRLKNCVRTGDIISRWGGDEFAILLPHIKKADNLYKITQRIIKELKYPFTVENNTQSLVSHLGMAIYPQNGQVPQDLLNYAETQLSYHKKTGNFNFIKENLSKVNASLSQIEKRLYEALRKEELCLYYQPQLNAHTKTTEAMEAFIRWQHPKYGLVPPKQFLPWVDKTELIVPLSRWILERACTQNKAWQTNHLQPILVSVNLSMAQFYHPQLVDIIDEILGTTGLEPQWLELEITEAVILKDIKLTYQVLRELKSLDVRVCLDDFGIGYAAVSHLHRLPFDTIKIDVSLIKEMDDKPENTTLVSALISLGESFDMRVVAEGVETRQQLNTLGDLQCQTMQGYYFSKPLSVEETTQFLTINHAELFDNLG